MLHIFGIRHHGPGSTRRLLRALRALQPDCLLIEAPQEAEDYFSYVTNDKLKPPVALLTYNPKELKQGSYLPFAKFSPEWQAIRYGLKANIPIRAMDLPMGIQFNLPPEAASPEATDVLPQKDPLGLMAQLAGYEDSERWWEATFEQEESDTEVFRVILEMISALREELPKQDSRETLLREAWMRKTIRNALKDGFQRIAIVCGAWHGPALQKTLDIAAKEDNALLRGLKKTKVESSWIPWSYERLARNSGYGAGVVSPAWYELIYDRRSELGLYWMIRVARLFRGEDLDTSSAHVTEAIRLANTLAALRGRSVPGIEELEEATVSIFCQGNTAPLDIIRERLVIGQKVGKVPPDVPTIPLQKDLEKQIRSARLKKEYDHSGQITKKLDLRKPANLLASQLLHRLQLLDIPWGTKGRVSVEAKGSFTENWKLRWKVSYALGVIEAGMWGSTIESACRNWVTDRIKNNEALSEQLDILDKVLAANLPELIPLLIHRIQELAAMDQDVRRLIEALPPLVNILRYGSTRETDHKALELLIDQLLPRIFIGLPIACTAVEDELATQLFSHIVQVQAAIGLLQRADYSAGWQQSLGQLSVTGSVHPLLRGLATRLLTDQGSLDEGTTTRRFSVALSPAVPTRESAQWLEGFLYGNGLLLLYNPGLWAVLEAWVQQLPADVFTETLPLLRRAFSGFSHAERRELMDLVKGKKVQIEESQPEPEAERAAQILPTLQQLLGI